VAGATQRDEAKSKGKIQLEREITTMKTRNLFMHIVGVFIALILARTVAQAATITVLATFDFPGTGNNTLPQKINDGGLIVGIVIDSAGVSKGFLRARSGNFSAAFSDPNDTGNFTEGRGINNSKVVNGDYLDGGTGTLHGYRLFNGTFTNYDAPNATQTIPLGINNVGAFCGSLILSDGITQLGFVNIAGNVTRFAIPDATATLAYSLNSSNQVTGYYIDAAGVTHGYLRASDGTLTFPIDAVGSTGTILFANNDANWVVGRYTDSSGVTHGLFFMTPDDIRTFDFPGAAGFTSLNGVNQGGYVSGRYLDSAGIAHGFLGVIDPNGAAQPEQSKSPVTPVKPAYPVRLGAPAL
jgi:hypothetical protein